MVETSPIKVALPFAICDKGASLKPIKMLKHIAHAEQATKDAESPMHRLHTDLLAERYGPVSIRLLRHDNEVREVHLIDRQRVSRTYAVTFLASPCPEEFTGIDAEIRDGAPIGSTFRKYGCEVRKNVLKALAVELPSWLRTEFAHSSPFAKAFIVEFLARIDARPPELYGTIIEIYSPDFLTSEITEADLLREGPTLKSLIASRVPHEEIWQLLGRGTARVRADSRYMSAWRNCRRDILMMGKRLASLLAREE